MFLCCDMFSKLLARCFYAATCWQHISRLRNVGNMFLCCKIFSNLFSNILATWFNTETCWQHVSMLRHVQKHWQHVSNDFQHVSTCCSIKFRPDSLVSTLVILTLSILNVIKVHIRFLIICQTEAHSQAPTWFNRHNDNEKKKKRLASYAFLFL